MIPLPQPPQAATVQTPPALPAHAETPPGDPAANTVPFPSPELPSASALTPAGLAAIFGPLTSNQPFDFARLLNILQNKETTPAPASPQFSHANPKLTPDSTLFHANPPSSQTPPAKASEFSNLPSALKTPHSEFSKLTSPFKKKLRSDSVFAKLSPEQHYKLRQWLREHSYSEVLTMVRRPVAEGGFGIDTHINSLYRYFQKQAGVDWLFMDMNLPNELLALADRSMHEASPFHPIASRFIERRLMFFASDPDSNIKSLTDLYKLVLKERDRKFKEIQFAAKHPELADQLQPHFSAHLRPTDLQTPDDLESEGEKSEAAAPFPLAGSPAIPSSDSSANQSAKTSATVEAPAMAEVPTASEGQAKPEVGQTLEPSRKPEAPSSPDAPEPPAIVSSTQKHSDFSI